MIDHPAITIGVCVALSVLIAIAIVMHADLGPPKDGGLHPPAL